MARPRSEEKRLALLNAAAETISVQGLAAPTALIAKKAGLAEGTLFRYFPTKEDLLNELYIYLHEQVFDVAMRDFPDSAELKVRAQVLWERYIDWGLANPAANDTINQLTVSSVLSPVTRLKVDAMFPEHTLELSQAKLFREQPVRFADAIFISLANVTMDFAASEPGVAEAYKKKGFAIIWTLFGNE